MLDVNKTLAEVAELVGGKVVGDKTLVIKGLSGIKEAQKGDLTFLANSKYLSLAKDSQASAILVSKDVELDKKAVIVVENPSFAFAQLINAILKTDQYLPKGIHKTAVVADDAQLGKDVAVGAHAVIESQAKIGDNTVIEAGSFVGHETQIGENCHIYPNVTVRERLTLGSGVIIHSGTVIGSDGFGFELVGGIHEKIPQIGTVVIEDDVEIGANVTIDRARFDKTFIGQGTKIDNLVQIAHNVIIGPRCIIVAQVGISGSVEIGEGSILAGQAGVAGHLTIGEGAVVAAQAGVTKSVPPGAKVSGYPALEHTEARKLHASLKRLPGYIKTVRELTQRLEELEKQIKK